ncbi:DMT family transporter [Geodermatophilus sp. SYSU D00758]
MLVAVLAALAAGACFAAAGLLQQRAARTRTRGEAGSARLMADLARQPMWLAGIGLAFLSYGFQALALAFGPLSLVQPLIVMELVFALPIAARLNDERMQPRDWAGSAAVAGGLALAILAAAPSEGDPRAPLGDWLVLLGVVGALVVAALLLTRVGRGPLRASVFALAGAAVMGTQSALYDLTIERLGDGFWGLFAHWQTYLLVVASIGGLWLIQSAYNSGPLAASMPVIDAVEPTVAVTIGLVLFGEELAGGAGRHALAALGALVAVAGIVVLDTSPLTRRMQAEEEQEQQGRQGAGTDG